MSIVINNKNMPVSLQVTEFLVALGRSSSFDFMLLNNHLEWAVSVIETFVLNEAV